MDHLELTALLVADFTLANLLRLETRRARLYDRCTRCGHARIDHAAGRLCIAADVCLHQPCSAKGCDGNAHDCHCQAFAGGRPTAEVVA